MPVTFVDTLSQSIHTPNTGKQVMIDKDKRILLDIREYIDRYDLVERAMQCFQSFNIHFLTMRSNIITIIL